MNDQSSYNSDTSSGKPSESNKLMLVVIVSIALLLILGLVRLLNTSKGHRDLVADLESKTFGNKWVAAYELSKVLATGNFPQEDIPWLVENLSKQYQEATDIRTRDFLIVALGSLKSPNTKAVLEKALEDESDSVKFHALVAVGNQPRGTLFDWSRVMKLLESGDHAMQHAAILVLASHRVQTAQGKLQGFLAHGDISLRYAAATGLILFRDSQAIPVLREIVTSKVSNDFDQQKLQALKLNVLHSMQSEKWFVLNSEIEQVLDQEKDLKVLAKMRELLKELKK